MNPLEEKGRWGEDQLKAIHSRFGWLVWGVVCFVSSVFCIFVRFFSPHKKISNRFITTVVFYTNSLCYSQYSVFSLILCLSG